MHEIENEIRQWRSTIADSNSVTSENVVEFESHLRETIAAIVEKGLSVNEAFVIASRRLGTPDQLVTEYSKVMDRWSDERLPSHALENPPSRIQATLPTKNQDSNQSNLLRENELGYLALGFLQLL